MTISTSPSYPIPGEEVTLSASSTVGATSFTWELLSVPESSSLTAGILEGDTFTPDVQGDYAVVAYDHIGDALVATQTATVTCCELIKYSFRTLRGDGATCEFRIALSEIKTATATSFLNEASQRAFLYTTGTYLSDLVGETVTSIGGNLAARVVELQTHFANHLTDAVHNYNDSTNSLVEFRSASNQAAIAAINDLRAKLAGHMVDFTTSPRWHRDIDDTETEIEVGPAGNVADAWFLAACLARSMTAHFGVVNLFTTSRVHSASDTDTPPAPGLFEKMLQRFLTDIASPSRSLGYNYGSEFTNRFGMTQGDIGA